MDREATSEQIAEIFSVSKVAVLGWAKSGCPHTKRRGKFLWNEGEVAQWRQTQRGPGRPKAPGSRRLEDVKIEKETELVTKFRRQNQLEAGRLHDGADCDLRQLARIRIVRGKLNDLAANLPPLLLGKDEPTMSVVIQKHVDQILAEFAGNAPAAILARARARSAEERESARTAEEAHAAAAAHDPGATTPGSSSGNNGDPQPPRPRP